jgi:hypothetical protein
MTWPKLMKHGHEFVVADKSWGVDGGRVEGGKEESVLG